MGVASVGKHLIVAVEIFGIDSVVGVFSQLAAVANAGKTLLLGADAACHQQPWRVLGRPGDDVDHAIDRVGAPKRGARAANHLNPVNVFEQRVLRVPIHAGEQRRVKAAPVHQNEKLVCEQIVEAAGTDCPVVGVHARHLHARNQAQRLGNARHAGTPQIVSRQDGNGGRRF